MMAASFSAQGHIIAGDERGGAVVYHNNGSFNSHPHRDHILPDAEQGAHVLTAVGTKLVAVTGDRSRQLVVCDLGPRKEAHHLIGGITPQWAASHAISTMAATRDTWTNTNFWDVTMSDCSVANTIQIQRDESATMQKVRSTPPTYTAGTFPAASVQICSPRRVKSAYAVYPSNGASSPRISRSRECRAVEDMISDATTRIFAPEDKLHLKPIGSTPLTATDLGRVLDHLSTLDGLPREFSMRLTEPDLTVTMRYGKLAADKPDSAVDDLLAAWHARMAERIQTMKGHTTNVTSVAFLPDGTMVTGSWDGTTKLRDKRGVCTTTMEHGGAVRCIAVSPDGSTIASGGTDHKIKLWDQTGRLVKTLEGHTNDVRSLAFSPDGKTLVSGSYDKTVRTWDVATGVCRTMEGHSDWVLSVAISPDGALLASGSCDSTIRLWDTRTWECVAVLRGHASFVISVAFSPDGRTLASGSGDNTIKLWSIGSGECLKTLWGHADIVWSVAFSPDGSTLLSGSSDNTAKQWPSTNSPEIEEVCAQPTLGADIRLPSDDSPLYLADLARVVIHILATGLPRSFEMRLAHPECTVSLGPTGFTSSQAADVEALLELLNRHPMLLTLLAETRALNAVDEALYVAADLSDAKRLLAAAGPHAEQHEARVLALRTDLARLQPVQALANDPMPALRGRVKEALERSDELHAHIISGDVGMMRSKTLLRSVKFSPVVLNCLDREGRSPLHSAFVHDQPQAFAALLKAGCLLDDAFPDGHPLLAAVAKPPMLAAMLDTRVDLDTVSRNTTALVVAIQGGHWDSATKLLARGADPLLPPVGVNALQAVKGVADPLMAGVIRAAINDALTKQLSDAIMQGDTAAVKRLLAAGVSANGVDGKMPPLFAAVKAGNFDIVSLLLKHGADRAATYKGKTAAQTVKKGSMAVFRGTYGGTDCAVKVVARADLNAVQASRLQNEIFVHKQLRHSNVVALYALEQDDREIRLALELASGSLSALLL
ncbi:WD domain G-beta repeat [Carpediemonas membranifera]|uniref:WD domain G-beta repeat n=1 Tax=Carpediemonas membranifera TaxID=201153 RepID=A0A8J6ARM2_9EUKA|nr:WD domain G-beta repeat [Carpediemonas membranifera]|eukprot:KAG9392218.1 WD domain G-beta repeat [Carpediemonas membranifera]